jgi:hypothetical protein
MDLSGPLDLVDDEPPARHGYGVNLICLFVRLTMSGVSLRGGARVLAIVAEACGVLVEVPHWTTGRLWLMRLGHAVLTLPLEKTEDWAWIVDHSVQIGQEKCLVVLGIRLRDLPPCGKSLQHSDMSLVALVPRTSWTRTDVAEVLEQVVERTGVPRVIVDDHGGDLHGGVQIFQERHARTKEVYDIKHKAACLLKQRLEKDPRWQEFQRQVGQTRCAIQQTEMAFLTPPAPKPKARFMNLQPQLEWAGGVLEILRDPPAQVLEWTSPPRLQTKLGWLNEFSDTVSEWSHWQQVVNITVEHVNRQGISRHTAADLRRAMPRRFAHGSTRKLVNDLVSFVREQGRQTRRGERFPGSTEVLESCFGKMKELEKQQSRGGFTSLLVSFGALLMNLTSRRIEAALKHSSTKHVYEWCKAQLGTTVFAKRKLAFSRCATNSG